MTGKRADQVICRFSSVLERSDNRLWGCHFRVPERTAKRFIDGDSRRVICKLNDAAEFPCGLLHRGPRMFLITVNKKLRESLGLTFGMEVDVQLRRDESAYGLPMPEEFAVLLQQDRKGNTLFHALSPGKQRTLLYIIGSVKSSDKRIARGLAVVTHLKSNGGTIDYRQLNALIKQSRS